MSTTDNETGVMVSGSNNTLENGSNTNTSNVLDTSTSTSTIDSDNVTLENSNTSASSGLAPPLVKLTGYRILNIVLIATFVAAKAILTYRGRPSATTLDWLLGGVIAIGLWWLGLYESVAPPIFPWLFHDDYSRAVYTAAFFILILFSVTLLILKSIQIFTGEGITMAIKLEWTLGIIGGLVGGVLMASVDGWAETYWLRRRRGVPLWYKLLYRLIIMVLSYVCGVSILLYDLISRSHI